MMIQEVEIAMYNLNYGKTCYKCDSERVEYQTINKVSGNPTWRNLYAACYQHRNISDDDLKALDKQRQDEYGVVYYMDAKDLHGMGLINNPSNTDLERYFKRQKNRFGK